MDTHGTSDPGKFKTVEFEQRIKADPKKVNEIMIDEECYSRRTAAFAAGCHFKGSWKEESNIQFTLPTKSEKWTVCSVKSR